MDNRAKRVQTYMTAILSNPEWMLAAIGRQGIHSIYKEIMSLETSLEDAIYDKDRKLGFE